MLFDPEKAKKQYCAPFSDWTCPRWAVAPINTPNSDVRGSWSPTVHRSRGWGIKCQEVSKNVFRQFFCREEFLAEPKENHHHWNNSWGLPLRNNIGQQNSRNNKKIHQVLSNRKLTNDQLYMEQWNNTYYAVTQGPNLSHGKILAVGMRLEFN